MNEIKTFIELWSADTALSILAFLFAAQNLAKCFDWLFDRYGLQTKRSLRLKADKEMLLRHEQKLNSISFDVHTTRDKVNMLKQMKNK